MINNEFYDDLKEKWYHAEDHPIALLRAENTSRMPWLLDSIKGHFGKKKCQILDIGCGAGFTANRLAQAGHRVTGIDLSEESLMVARKEDATGTVLYKKEDASSLPFKEGSFDIILAMDLLEHVEDPEKIIKNASRLLSKRGLFFFHTFNRNPYSYLIAIKGVSWFVRNTPKNMHVYKMFIKPAEIEKYCTMCRLKVHKIVGMSPKLNTAFWKMLLTRKIAPDFQFKITSSLMVGYSGYAIKH